MSPKVARQKKVRGQKRRERAGERRVNIRPGVSVLSVLSHLNYQPWFALAEFVDNSIQSFLDCGDQLVSIEGDGYRLRVDIEISRDDEGRITIRDNAAGIHQADFPRAFRPAELPDDRTGLCEFGMGMKSAACWFSPHWSVRTSALGEPTEKAVVFDISKIVRDEIEELDVEVREAPRNRHFTEIVLTRVDRLPQRRTLAKIKEHLTDIYRCFTSNGDLVLRLNGEELKYEQPEILEAPPYNSDNEPEGEPRLWRWDFDFDFGEGLKARGFAALRKKGSTRRAGFALFRRHRLVQDSGDEGYRPKAIFGDPNSYAYQRVFGEIHLDGFEVTHTKDGFRWDENEEPFLELLKEKLSTSGMPLLRQAENYRVRPTRSELRSTAVGAATRTGNAIRTHVPPVLDEIRGREAEDSTPSELPEAANATERTIDVTLHGQEWRIVLELTDDPAVGDWLEVSDTELAQNPRIVRLRLSLVHPFTSRFGAPATDPIETLARIAAGLGLAEVAAREAGVRMAGQVRRNLNELLRNALWRSGAE